MYISLKRLKNLDTSILISGPIQELQKIDLFFPGPASVFVQILSVEPINSIYYSDNYHYILSFVMMFQEHNESF